MAADDILVYKNAAGTVVFSVSAAGAVVAGGSITSTPVTNFGVSGMATDVIAESTSAAGVTIDSVLLKDGSVGSTANPVEVVTFTAAVGGADMWATCPSAASGSVLAHTFFDDFIGSVFSASQWVLVADGAGTAVISDVLHGACTITCAATSDNDGNQITYSQETFRLTSGKKLWFEAVIKSASGDMVNSDWTVGLIETEDLTGVADNMPANGVVFHKEDGAATFSISSSDNGTNLQTLAVGTIVDATNIRIGFLFDGGATGAATITPYVNGVAGTPIAAVTYATMAELAPFIMVRNGDGIVTQTLVTDYIKAVQAR